MIHLEMKFLSSCERVKSYKLCASKIQQWDSCRIDIPIPKWKNKKEGRSDRYQVSLKHSNTSSVRSESWRIIFQLLLCRSGPLGYQSHLQDQLGWRSHLQGPLKGWLCPYSSHLQGSARGPNVNFDQLLRQGPLGFATVLLFFPLSILYSLEGCHYAWPTLWSRELFSVLVSSGLYNKSAQTR